MIFIKFNGRDDNFGDKLIFSCLQSELARYDDVYIFGRSPEGSAQRALRFREAFALAASGRLKGRRTLVFHPPGARFLPKDTLKPRLIERVKDKAILFIWSLIGAKLHITGISIGERFNAEHYKRFETIGVRDKRSEELLSGIVKNVKLCPDMAFLRLPKFKVSLEPAVFVSLREETPDDFYDSNYQSALKASLKSALVPFFRNQWDVSFFSNVVEDKNFNISLSEEFANTHPLVNYVDSMPEDLDYSRFFTGFGAVVSNRLHVLLPAMTEGLLPIALISRTHYKIINLFSSFGFDKFIIYTDERAEVITSKISDLLEQNESLRKENYARLFELKGDVEKYIGTVVMPET